MTARGVHPVAPPRLPPPRHRLRPPRRCLADPSSCTLLHRSLWALAHYRDLRSLYSAVNSNLDVAALAWLQSAALACLLMHVATPRRRFSGMVVPPHYTKVGWCGCY